MRWNAGVKSQIRVMARAWGSFRTRRGGQWSCSDAWATGVDRGTNAGGQYLKAAAVELSTLEVPSTCSAASLPGPSGKPTVRCSALQCGQPAASGSPCIPASPGTQVQQ